MKEAQERLASLFAEISGENSAKVQETVESLVEAIKVDVAGQVSEQIDRLTEQRDQFLARAQKAEEELAEHVAKTKETTQLESNAEVERLQLELEALKKEHDGLKESYDQIEGDLSKKFLEESEEKLASCVKNVARFLENRIASMYEKIRKEIENDPNTMSESALLNDIVSLVQNHASAKSGEAINDERFTALEEECIALRTQVKVLEGRNTKLQEEQRVIEEKMKLKACSMDAEADKTKACAIDAEADKDKTKPCNEDTSIAEPVAEPPVADKKNEIEGNPEHVSESTDATVTTPSKIKRASALLKEVLSGQASEDEAKDQPGWVEDKDVLDRLSQTRQERSERSSVVEARGTSMGLEDIVREDGGSQGSAKIDESKVIAGTAMTQGDYKKHFAGKDRVIPG